MENKTTSPKMFVTAAEANAMGLRSTDEQIRRWNDFQKQIRAEEALK